MKQLQAGELLLVEDRGGQPHIETHRYYRFLHTEPEHYDEHAMLGELDRVAEASIRRLAEYAGDRQVVLPLSGGYDSRLIATLLRRIGYDNVLTLSYGVRGNRESEYSRRVAEALGYPWHFVEYSDDHWRAAWESDERRNYQLWASGLASLPHVQDWLAVKLLRATGAVEEDAVFAPGHCCVTGMIPQYVFDKEVHSRSAFVESLQRVHFRLIPATAESGNRVQQFAPDTEIISAEEFVRGFMAFGWQERQAKFIANSVRVYEFWGYDWWLPLWDAEFMRFWEGVPLRLRRGREWYKQYVRKTYGRQTNTLSEGVGNASDHGPAATWTKALARAVLPQAWQQRARAMVAARRASRHHLAALARYPHDDVKGMLREGYTSNGISAHFFLQLAQGVLARETCEAEA